MGLITWIKDKYNNHKFQKATQVLSDGKIDQAVEIFKEILDSHPDAPFSLLSIYHSIILKGNRNSVSDVVSLYENHKFLKDKCIDFAKQLESTNQAYLHIDYCQALYSKGISELLNSFVNSATDLVVNTNYISNLESLTKNTYLLQSLSDSILTNAQKRHILEKNLVESERLCLLIKPYLSSKTFYEFYSEVRFNLIIQKNITEESVKQIDTLFQEIKTVYRLSDATLRAFIDKSSILAKDSFEKQDYVAALLVSKRIVKDNLNAREIYADSALKLYISSNSKAYLIESDILYKCLGNTDSILINSLEPFVPYAKHREKYISVATSELSRLVTTGEEKQAENLLDKVWSLTPDKSIIIAILSNGSKRSRTHFTTLIVNDCKKFLPNNSYIDTYVKELSKLDDSEFIITTLETLLNKGGSIRKSIISAYESQIIRFANNQKEKSRKRIETIERGLTNIQTDRLYTANASNLNDYIYSGRYDSEFAIKVAASLIGYNDLAEPLAAKILVDESKKSKDDITCEQKLREALSVNNTHNKLFNKTAYNAVLTEIREQIIHLAKELYVSQQSRAVELLYLLRDNSLSWFDTYAALYLDSIQNEENSEEIASKVFVIIKEGDGISSSYNDALWTKYVSAKSSIICKKTIDEAIADLTVLLSEVNSLCNSDNKESLTKEISSCLSKKLLSRAKKHEKNHAYDKAIGDYTSILNISRNFFDIRVRISICKLKDNKSLSSKEAEEINNLLSINKDKKYQQDLAFRWCIYLISNNLSEKAEEINKRILGTDNEIAQLCQEERIKIQQSILDGLNDQIHKLNNSELTPEEAIAFGLSLSKTLSDINLIVQVSTQKSNILKESIRLYAIEMFYIQGNYIQSLNGLKVHDSTYLSDPIALRNIAIMCLNAAEDGLLTENNYKELLAIWATTIYQQKIFVDSLNYTSWDDSYTFTLESALGQLGDTDELPDNINYDTPSDNSVISILEVQKTLLSRMEAAIQNNVEYQQFLSSQLEAMDKLAEQNLDESCVLVAPYMLSISNTYNSNVTKALTIEANGHYGNWEAILEIGSIYGLNNGDFKKYSSALDSLNSAIASIEKKQKIKSSFTKTRILQIKEFENLMANLTSTVMTAMNNDIAQDIEYSQLYSDYGVVIKIIGDDTLSFTFSNYINQQIVKTLNDKNQTLAQGTPLLFNIYDFCKCNPHLRRNLENIIEALIHNYITDGDEENITVLNNILSSTREFDSQVVKALKGGDGVPEEMMTLLFSSNEQRFNVLKTKIGNKSAAIQNQFNATSAKMKTIKIQIEMSQIVDQVNNNTLDKWDALQKVYNIYKNNKDNASVCKNLSTLIPMCVMEYIIPDKYGKSKVEAVLNSLKSNMSSTFRSNNSEISEAYSMIWNQLPYNARSAIQNNPWSLNEQGEALKKGLDYLKDLGR